MNAFGEGRADLQLHPTVKPVAMARLPFETTRAARGSFSIPFWDQAPP